MLCHVDSFRIPFCFKHVAIYQPEDYDSFFWFPFDLNDNVKKKVLKLCFRQCQTHIKFLTAQRSATVISPEGGTGTTANTSLSACNLGSRLVFAVSYPVTGPLQSSHRTSCCD